MLWRVIISVDNNRYGCYFRRFAKKEYIIEAESKNEAYHKAAQETKKIKRYKNCIVRHIDNIGHHDYSSYSINLESIRNY